MTKVLVVNECHLQRTADGNYWSNGIVDYEVFKRYLSVFDEVLVAIRSVDAEKRGEDYIHLCNGERVNILPLPDFIGASGLLRNRREMKRQIKKCCELADCAIIRTPSAISFPFLQTIAKEMPYALEVSGDPWMHMAPGEYRSIFRPLIRQMFTKELKKYCQRANGVSYVTEHALQEKYPCKALVEGESREYFSSHYSTVSINGQIKYDPKVYKKKQAYKLIHIANAFTTYGKGHKEVLDVVFRLNRKGVQVFVDFIGDGPLRTEFEEYADKLEIRDKVYFRGRLSNKEEIYTALREADLFLFPTHSEGLPRVVIESMYVGTPCISTCVGGIPELLDEESIVEVGAVDRMYEIVKNLFEHPEVMSDLSRKCIEKAGEYTEEVLQKRRVEFCGKLKSLC